MNRLEIADHIAERLGQESTRMAAEFRQAGRINSATIDDLLPEPVARAIYERFPSTDKMMLKRSLKEHKLVAAQMDKYDPLLEEAVYAFQDPRVVALVEHITGLKALEPDEHLYAGGISLMAKGGYLRPHLDNSHDAERGRYRVLNLLFYVTPDWALSDGGSLQLWDEGPLTRPRSVESRFNRLVLMITNQSSWHSVSEVVAPGKRCCVSNYYFSQEAPTGQDYFHATTFRDEQASAADLVMQADNALRTTVLKLWPGYTNRHRYVR